MDTIAHGLSVVQGAALILIILGMVLVIIMALGLAMIAKRYGRHDDRLGDILLILFSKKKRRERALEKGEEKDPLFKDY